MSSMRTLDTEKLRTRRIVATATLTVFTIAVLLLSETSAAVSATPPGAAPSYQAGRFTRDPAQAEQMPAGQSPAEARARYEVPAASAEETEVQAASTARPVRPQEH
jgi:hypothetical protein